MFSYKNLVKMHISLCIIMAIGFGYLIYKGHTTTDGQKIISFMH